MLFLNDDQSLSHPQIQRRLKNGGPVGLTIGNFDGMHVGHQLLFSTLESELGKRLGGGRRLLFTFEPHPRRFFSKISRAQALERPDTWAISLLREKVELARHFGLEFFFCKRFTPQFSALSAKDFAKKYICEAFDAKLVVVGNDWRFGKGRTAGAEELSRLGRELGFEVIIADPVIQNGIRVSSTAVKEALAAGDLDMVRALLGRDFEVSDRVWKGDGRGSRIGVPTANLRGQLRLLPANGVYATYVTLNGKIFVGAANVGVRPTVDGTKRFLEVHLLDWNGGELYKQRLNVRFVKRIRDEIRFDSIEALKSAIHADIATVRKLLPQT